MSETWPVLRTYDRNHLVRIAMPVGGIGTGTVSFGGRGNLRDWEVANRPAKGFRPREAFLALYVRDVKSSGPALVRALEGPLDDSEFEGSEGSVAQNHGLPRFRDASFEAAYPFGAVDLRDPAVPLGVRLEAFNPLIPNDVEGSSWPLAAIRVRVTNLTNRPMSVSVLFALSNFIGQDGSTNDAKDNVNERRTEGPLAGLFMRSDGVPAQSPAWGTVALVSADADLHSVTTRSTGVPLGWGGERLELWDDFADDGKLDEKVATQKSPTPLGAIAVAFDLPAGASDTATFLLTWHFPNRLSWTPGGKESWFDGPKVRVGEPIIGNHYTTQFSDAWDVVTKVSSRLPELEKRSIEFVRAFVESDLPDVVKESALFNLSTLRSQTCFRTPDGKLFGWEGVHDKDGSCYGSCTHVWNYELVTPFLFANLARSMREVEFLHMTRDDGHMNFRCGLPLQYATIHGLAAADGQMGCVIKLYREWKLSGDDAWLGKLWPHAKLATEFCWIPGGWDADVDGVMEGCQHNTMDVEYFGPNPQMEALYLAALRSAELMARAVGDEAFAAKCADLFTRGSRWTDEHLFNGEYYEHHIVPPVSKDAIAPGLRHAGMGTADVTNPDLQLGAGCLVDQLVGQYLAHAAGLGYVLDESHVKTTLASVLKHNQRDGFFDHFNPMRSYVLGDERALLMASYPRGRRPTRPFPYYAEVMTGFEHTAAVGMLQEGMIDEGLGVIADIRARYDGRRRNPFDEAECGHHYARAMASWGAVLALTGFDYDAAKAEMSFADARKPVRWFWSNGSSWGTFSVNEDQTVELKVVGGAPLRLRFIRIGSRSPISVKGVRDGLVSPGGVVTG